MIPTGKGVFLWQVKRVRSGDPRLIAGAAHNARLTHVLIKVADGTNSYNINNGVDMVPNLVAALRARGIQPWGWQYVYGKNPIAEAKKAIQRVKQLNLAGFVVNAEGPFKTKGMDKVAKTYMTELRKELPKLTIGLSSYRYPSYHLDFPFKAFLDFCDVNMPQVYWMDMNNPGQQLQKSVTEFRALMPNQPIVPTGSVFSHGSWSVTPEQLTEFFMKARALKLPGANLWEMATAREKAIWWRAICDYDWDSVPPHKEEKVNLPVTTLADPKLNIRSGPGTQFNIVGSYQFKSSVIIINIVRKNRGLWGKTDLGWIALRYNGSALTDICS
ncbi:MAG: SH3 domain-containing protein [Anaerolineales bacterium]